MSRRYYRIRVRGRLGERFRTAFDAFDLEDEPGTTVLCGVCVDASAFYGAIEALKSFGLEVLDVESFPVTPRLYPVR